MTDVPAQPAPEDWSRLMMQAQDGDAAAYRRLLSEIAPVLKAFLRPRLFSRDHVEDVSQEILLAIHTARHTYRPDQPFRHWMYGIARHKMLDHFRKTMRLNAHETNDETLVTFLAEPANNPEEALSAKELRQALDQLPDKQRRLVTMTKLEGYSLTEAAAKLGMTEGAAKVAAHRAHRKLKEWLMTHGYE